MKKRYNKDSSIDLYMKQSGENGININVRYYPEFQKEDEAIDEFYRLYERCIENQKIMDSYNEPKQYLITKNK